MKLFTFCFGNRSSRLDVPQGPAALILLDLSCTGLYPINPERWKYLQKSCKNHLQAHGFCRGPSARLSPICLPEERKMLLSLPKRCLWVDNEKLNTC